MIIGLSLVTLDRTGLNSVWLLGVLWVIVEDDTKRSVILTYITGAVSYSNISPIQYEV